MIKAAAGSAKDVAITGIVSAAVKRGICFLRVVRCLTGIAPVITGNDAWFMAARWILG